MNFLGKRLRKMKGMFNIVIFTMPKGQEFKVEGSGAKAKMAQKFMFVSKLENPKVIEEFKEKDLWRFALKIPTSESQRNLVYGSFLSDFIKEYPKETCLQYNDFVKDYGFEIKNNRLVKYE